MIEQYLTISTRLQRYARDTSKRGRSLVLSHLLLQLKKHPHFQEFSEILTSSARRIAEIGSLSELDERNRVMRSLQSYASEITEIVEDTKLTQRQVRSVLKDLIAEGAVRRKSRPNHLQPGEPDVELYFLIDQNTY